MSKLARFTQKLFGSTATANSIAEFGSLAASSPARYSGATITPAIVQALGNYLTGWKGAQVGAGNPAIEDMNALDYLFAYQLSYLFQQGIAEYDAGTTYYQYSVVQSSGVFYYSLIDTNTNNTPVSSPSDWANLGTLIGNQRVRAVTTDGTNPGVGGICYSQAVLSFSSSSTSLVDVTSLSCQLTTSGNPVKLSIQSDINVSAAAVISILDASVAQPSGFVAFLRASSVLGVEQLAIAAAPGAGNTGIFYSPSTFSYLDNVSAGTYTWKIQTRVSAGTTGIQFSNVRLVAMET